MEFYEYDTDNSLTGHTGHKIAGMPAHTRADSSGKLTPCKLVHADYLLIGAMAEELDECDTVIDYYGAAVRVKLRPASGKTYIYYEVAQRFVFTNVSIYGMLSRHFTSDFGDRYGAFTTLDYVFGDVPDSPCQHFDYRAVATWAGSLPISKITSDHHVHYTASEVWDLLNEDERTRAAYASLLPTDATTTTAAGFMIWLASINDLMFKYVIGSSMLIGQSMKDVAKKCKTISIRSKSLQNIVALDLREIFEADVLLNRSFGSVDWHAEKKNRTEVDGVRISEAEAYNEAVSIFGRPDATRENPRRMSWDTYFKNRWQWAAPGSIHSQYSEDLADLPSDYRLRTKFMQLIQTASVDKAHYLDRKPEIHAWASYKYEWAKMRAIYGTDLTSYVIAHLGFYNCEEVLPNEFPVGPKANDKYVRNKMASVLTDAVPFCVDYTDFNSQHSIPAMRAVMRAYRDVNAGMLHQDQIEAINWTISSLDNMVIHDNMGLKEQYKASGTLLSGWRLTTFINSVLNKIYMKKLVQDSSAMHRAVHNGDDVIIGIQSMSTALRVLRNSRKYNIRLQADKCALAGMAEFLRIEHRRGAHGQYLARNVATIVHSRVESPLATDWTQVVNAHEDRLSEFVTRGGDIDLAARLRTAYLVRRADQYKTPLASMYLVKQLHSVVGGLGTDKTCRIDKRVTITSDSADTDIPESLPGITDYARAVANALGLRGDVEKYSQLATRIRRATLKAMSYSTHSVKIDTNDDIKTSQVHLGLYKVFGKCNKASKFGKAKSVGMVLDIHASDDTMALLQSNARMCHDPLTYISVVC